MMRTGNPARTVTVARIDRATDGAREVEMPDDECDARLIDPARQIESDEFGRIVARCVGQLPPRQREVLVLVAYENLSTAEAAAVLGISEQNVRTTLHLAREKMRAKLAPHVKEQLRERG